MPFFSVIIPLYNKEAFIEQTLKHVLSQSFTDFEIIIVNDGSTDGSIEKINLLKDNRIRILHQKNQGVSVARNKGMELAEGKYFCFLDADDEWTENYLENLYHTILKFPDAEMYCSRYKTIIGKKKFAYCNLIDLPENYEGFVTDFFKSSIISRVAHTSAVAVDRNVFRTIGGFDIEISSGQDLDYWIRIALRYSVVICKNITLIYNYLHYNQSLSKTNINNKKLPDFEKFAVYEKINPSLKKFLDLYRIEYALHFHIAGNHKKKEEYLKETATENIIPKVKFLLSTPPFILRVFLFIKRYLKRFGVDFSVYH